ncbi:MAG: HAD-IIIC family phosphatase [Myxococcales bacterium]|nr:HAD-IIIC family phosphatase [Myxococcales bacterium]
MSLELTHSNSRVPLLKCVVWDLDDTIWEGTLLEGGGDALRLGVAELIKGLDARGVLQSIASRNDSSAMERLRSFGLDRYFLYPRFSWGRKSESLKEIASALNIGVDSLAFVDDQPFERDEVSACLPGVLTVDAGDLSRLLRDPRLPTGGTTEARQRRQLYQAEINRRVGEETFQGGREAFLRELGMVVTIRPANDDDLARAEELTSRTSQMNTTGRVYTARELHDMSRSSAHLVWVAELDDRYGGSGVVGLAVVTLERGLWVLELLITSCRVVSRGVGGVMLSCLLERAKAAGVRLQALFIPNEKNRISYVTYKFAGFLEAQTRSDVRVLEHPLVEIRPVPAHVAVVVKG